ncbi:MAG: hypothetical protein ACYTXA_25730 [Nostoc sp.]
MTGIVPLILVVAIVLIAIANTDTANGGSYCPAHLPSTITHPNIKDSAIAAINKPP